MLYFRRFLIAFLALARIAVGDGAAAPTSQPATDTTAAAALIQAQAAYDAAVKSAVERFRKTDEYRRAAEAARAAESSLELSRAAPETSPDAITAAATDSLDARAALGQLESRAVDADPGVQSARAALVTAKQGLTALRTPPTTQPATVPSD